MTPSAPATKAMFIHQILAAIVFSGAFTEGFAGGERRDFGSAFTSSSLASGISIRSGDAAIRAAASASRRSRNVIARESARPASRPAGSVGDTDAREKTAHRAPHSRDL